jgi:hypothetical protein
MEFGRHNTWGLKNYPKDKKERYQDVLKELAQYFTFLSGDKFEPSALDQQVAWATTRQESITTEGFAYQFLMNKAAAIEMGFLISSELPNYMVTQTAPRDKSAPTS